MDKTEGVLIFDFEWGISFLFAGLSTDIINR